MPELIARVVERYAQPANQQLKVRLLMAATFQKAFQTLESTQGTDFATRIFGTYKEIYDYLMRVQNTGTNLEFKSQHLLSTSPHELKPRYACEWLLDKKCWHELPNLLRGGTSTGK